ncbi:MAG: polysaccharide deacetylase family protein [Clostridia bacterium]|nr:polysaccharide deacetylase family protein [Clostridia bacterium]
MRKITHGGARVIACAFLSLILLGAAAISFYNVQTVSLLNSESYQPYYHGDREKPRVSLMVNVYENAVIVQKMIDLLGEYNAKATFFVGGCWADDNTETIKKIVDSGMEIANHGYFHKDLKTLSDPSVKAEVENTHALIKALCGVEMSLFAPPSGSFSTSALKTIEKCGYKSIMWSKDTIDWRDDDVDLLVSRATKNLENGDFILMHPKEHSLAAMERILKIINNSGFEAVTVSECLGVYG